ncbi:MAG: hypothetical protein ACREAM_25350 [Blastocatellia bacterium]
MTQKGLNTIKLGVLAAVVWASVLFGSNGNHHEVAAAGDDQVAAVSNDKLAWLDNYEAALKEAKKTGKPIFLEFRCAP